MNKKEFHKIIDLALKEDIGKKDITASLIPPSAIATAQIICQQKAVICGLGFVAAAFTKIDPKVKITWQVKDDLFVFKN